MVLGDAANEAICLQRLHMDLILTDLVDIVIYNDNMGAVQLVENPVFLASLEHIDVTHRFVRGHVNCGLNMFPPRT